MKEDAIYIQGFAGALAEVCRRRQSHLAANILRANEITIGDLENAGVEESDVAELRHALHGPANDTR